MTLDLLPDNFPGVDPASVYVQIAALRDQHQCHTLIGRVSSLKHWHPLARVFIQRRAERGNRCSVLLI